MSGGATAGSELELDPALDPSKPLFAFRGILARESLKGAEVLRAHPSDQRPASGVYTFDVGDSPGIMDLPTSLCQACPGAARFSMGLHATEANATEVLYHPSDGSLPVAVAECKLVPGRRGVRLLVAPTAFAATSDPDHPDLVTHIVIEAASPDSRKIHRCTLREPPDMRDLVLGFDRAGAALSADFAPLDCPWPRQLRVALTGPGEWRQIGGDKEWRWYELRQETDVRLVFALAQKPGEGLVVKIECPTISAIRNKALVLIERDKLLKSLLHRVEGGGNKRRTLLEERQFQADRCRDMQAQLQMALSPGSSDRGSVGRLRGEIADASARLQRIQTDLDELDREMEQANDSLKQQYARVADSLRETSALMDTTRRACQAARIRVLDPWDMPIGEFRIAFTELCPLKGIK